LYMNFIQKRWQNFKSKSFLGKSSDIFFIVFIVLMLTSDGRVLFQRIILNSGLFSSVEANKPQALTTQELNWSLIDLDGEAHALKEFEGKPIFINFWATWCPPCNAEMPGIIELMEQAQGKVNFVFVTRESPDLVKEHLESKGWDIPVFLYSGSPSESLSAEVLPTTVVINTKGEIIHKSNGMRKWNTSDALNLLGLEKD
jgi:thiol-disulfide isomerase/thioredoxin